MKKKETIGYAILAVLLFAAFTSIWNYRTSLPWLSGRLSPVITPVLLGICIGFVLNMPAKAIEKRLHVRHARGISIAASIILLLIAAALLTVLPELLRSMNDYRMLIYAILLIAMMLFNNSPLKARLLEKRGMKQMAKLEKSERGGA